MYIVLYNNSGGSLQSKSFPELEEANEEILELTEKQCVNVRLLTDVIDEDFVSPYKELYHQLYNDFVKPKREIKAVEEFNGYSEIGDTK